MLLDYEYDVDVIGTIYRLSLNGLVVTMSNLICSVCFKKVQKDSVIVCKICKCKLHKFCAKIDNEKAVSALSSFVNIVYNCDNCLQSGCDLVKKVSILAYEIEELKFMFSQFLSSNNKNNDNSNSSHRSFLLSKTGLESDSRSQPLPDLSSIDKTITLPYVGDNAAANLTARVTVDDVSSNNNNNNNLSSSHRSVVLTKTGLESDSRSQLLPCVSSIEKTTTVDVCAGSSLPNVDDIAAVDDVVANALVVNTVVATVPNDDVFSDAVDEVPICAGSTNNAEWKNVAKRKQNKRRAVIGMNKNAELDVVTKKKWVHLGSFKPTVTAECIISYVVEHLHIDKDSISCYSLVKKDVSPQDLKYVNFKLGVDSEIYDKLFKPELWTANIKVRPFKFFPIKKPPLAEV